MRTLSRSMIRAAALLAAAAPALATSVAHTGPMSRVGHVFPYPPFITRISTYVLAPGAGGGTGAYRLPSAGNGSATIQLYDEDGRILYVVSAVLVRAPDSPPDGEAEQGGFHGTLFAVDIDGDLVGAAQVLGKWIREPDGRGSFGADILVPESESRDHPMVAVGAIAGALRTGLPRGGASGTDDLRARATTGVARLSATWIVQP